MSITQEPRGFSIIMQIIAEAWQHRRETPFMMNIEWQEEWHNSIENIRTTYGIRPYKSIFPTDLLESMESASLWKKLLLSSQLIKYQFTLPQKKYQATIAWPGSNHGSRVTQLLSSNHFSRRRAVSPDLSREDM